jgi:hypothetical protein
MSFADISGPIRTVNSVFKNCFLCFEKLMVINLTDTNSADPYCCCLCQWGKTMSLNCCPQQAYCSFLRDI